MQPVEDFIPPYRGIGQVSELVDDVLTSNGFHFRKTTWHGINVIENVETGYYSAADPCKKYKKRFNAWFVNKKTKEFLDIASNELKLSANPQILQRNEQETDVNPSTRILVGSLIIEIHSVDNDLRGSFIHPIIFHSFAEWISPEYATKVRQLMTRIATEQTIARNASSITPSPIEVDESEVISIRDKRFRLYNYFGHQVYQDIETGWLNAGKFVKAVAKITGKKIDLRDFKKTDDWQLAIEFGRRALLEQGKISSPASPSENSNENLEKERTGISPLASEADNSNENLEKERTGKSRFVPDSDNSNENLEKERTGISPLASEAGIEAQILRIYGEQYLEAKGSYVPYRVFQLVALWADKRHKLEVLEFLQAVNENANAFNRDAYAVLKSEKEKLIAENEALKSKNENKNHSLNELEAELVSRAIKIDELESEIHDLTTPIDTRFAPPTAYAKAVGNDYFQLKVSASILGPNVPTLRRESFVGALDCVKQAKQELKKRELIVNLNGNSVIERSHLDETFDILHQIKERKTSSVQIDRNQWLDEQIAYWRSRRQTAQAKGKLFELEYIRAHAELTPWELVPKEIKNQLNEFVKDTGIDAIVINENGAVNEIVQLKYKRVPRSGNPYSIRMHELSSFVSKCEQERYRQLHKCLVLKGSILGPRIRKTLEALNITIEIVD